MARKLPSSIVKGDRVRVIRGNFRDMEGPVLSVIPAKERVVVEGVNMRKRHERPSEANPEGGIITFEAPIRQYRRRGRRDRQGCYSKLAREKR